MLGRLGLSLSIGDISEGKSFELGLGEQNKLVDAHFIGICGVGVVVVDFLDILVENYRSKGVLETESELGSILPHPEIESRHIYRRNSTGRSALTAVLLVIVVVSGVLDVDLGVDVDLVVGANWVVGAVAGVEGVLAELCDLAEGGGAQEEPYNGVD